MPTLSHAFYIPVILLLGFAVGFRYGAGAARKELQERAKRRKQ